MASRKPKVPRRVRSQRRRRRSAGATVMLLGITFGSVVFEATPALATNFGSLCSSEFPDHCVSLANNATHAIRYVNLECCYPSQNYIPGMTVAADWAIVRYDDYTVLRVYRDQSDPYPDVELHDWDYGETPWIAATKCPSTNTGVGGAHPNRWCRGQQIIFNSRYYWRYTGYYDTAFQRRAVACHEMGHTVGLRHRAPAPYSCMYTYANQGTSSILDQHDIDHINARYS